jgi:hypothetical protein
MYTAAILRKDNEPKICKASALQQGKAMLTNFWSPLHTFDTILVVSNDLLLPCGCVCPAGMCKSNVLPVRCKASAASHLHVLLHSHFAC